MQAVQASVPAGAQSEVTPLNFPDALSALIERRAVVTFSDGTQFRLEDFKRTFSPDQWMEMCSRVKPEQLQVDRNIARTVLEYNQRYAVLIDNGDVLVLDRRTNQLLTRAKLFEADVSEIDIEDLDKEGNKIIKTVRRAKVWFESLARVEYVGKALFPRNLDRLGKDFRENPETRQCFNTWQEFDLYARGKLPDHGTARFWNHLREVVCRGNDEHYSYVRRWLAHRMQKPHEKPRVALVFHSAEKQTGKSLVGELYRECLGTQHTCVVDKSDQLVGRFTDLDNIIFCQVEEAVFSGDKRTVNALKNVITNSMLPREQKGVQGVATVANFTAFMFCTNADKPVALDGGEERFFCLNVDPSRKGNKAYFSAIYREMREEEGLANLMYDLQMEDLEDFVPWDAPFSSALGEMMLKGEEGTIKGAIIEAVREGVVRIDGDANKIWSKEGPFRISANDLYAAFEKVTRGYGERQGSMTAIGMALRELFPDLKKMDANTRDRRPSAVYVLPPLGEARQALARHYNVSVDLLGGKCNAHWSEAGMKAQAEHALMVLHGYVHLPDDMRTDIRDRINEIDRLRRAMDGDDEQTTVH